MAGGTFNVPNGLLNIGWDSVGFLSMSGGTINAWGIRIDASGGPRPAVAPTTPSG
jgi:hypothetical protein